MGLDVPFEGPSSGLSSASTSGIATPNSTRPNTGANTPTTKNSKGANTPTPSNLKKVRVLMLHGFAQSGSIFEGKTAALRKALAKALRVTGLELDAVFPTAPTKLKIDDALHFERRQPPIDGYEPDTWAWWRHDPAQDKYLLLEEGMATVAQALWDARTRAAEEGDEDGGGIDGVFGFSQGGCLAAMLAAALEEVHKPRAATERVHEGWLKMVREANGGRPLKFAVVVGGFRAGPLELEWLYNPKIRTPTLHLIGTVDTVVGEDRSRDLASKCVEPSILPHAGGHHVPHNKFIVGAVAGFIGKYYEGWETETETEAGTQTEEKVEKETETGTKTPTEGVLIDL